MCVNFRPGQSIIHFSLLIDTNTWQMFYTYRVYMISKKAWLAVPPFFAEVFRFCLSFVITALAWKKGNLPAYRAQYDYLVYVTLITSVTVRMLRSFSICDNLNLLKVDVWNTVSLCYYLRSRRATFKK
jgi:hypothetical protein